MQGMHAQSCLFVTPWTSAPGSLSMEFSRQGYWSGFPFPLEDTAGNLLDPGIETASPVSPTLAGEFFTTEPPGNSKLSLKAVLKREMVVCVLDSESTSRSISEELYLRGKLKSYSAGPPKPELISEAVPESMWLLTA